MTEHRGLPRYSRFRQAALYFYADATVNAYPS